MVLEKRHVPFLETVPFKVIVYFTLLQLAVVGGIYGLTWAGIAGVLFPIPIMLLVPFRQYIMPRLFNNAYLEELDRITEETTEPLPHEAAVREAEEQGLGHGPSSSLTNDVDPGEVIDSEMAHYRVVHHTPHASVRERRTRN